MQGAVCEEEVWSENMTDYTLYPHEQLLNIIRNIAVNRPAMIACLVADGFIFGVAFEGRTVDITATLLFIVGVLCASTVLLLSDTECEGDEE